MAVPRSLRAYARQRFNTDAGFWYFTKAKALKQDSMTQIVAYHSLLNDIAVGKDWTSEIQQRYANAAAGRPASSAWARELKVFLGHLGTAWVQASNKAVLTEVGQRLMATSDPNRTVCQQVRKYQLGNPNINKDLTKGIALVPHHAFLKLLLAQGLKRVSKSEFIAFVSHIRDAEEGVQQAAEAIRSFRGLSDADKTRFLGSLDGEKWRVIERIWPYLANFLCFPDYLDYSSAAMRVVDMDAAQRVLKWYEVGHAEHIEFATNKDWFAHYGREESQPSALDAIDYYRSTHDTERAKGAFRRAVERGHLRPDESEEEFGCRIQGEARVEDWLVEHLDRLEPGLIYEQRQYETIDAGRLDILARQPGGDFVVVELKRDKAHDAAFGQLLRYMGWVRMNLSDTQVVRGYVVGEEIDDRMVYVTLACDELDDLCKLRKYSDLQIRLDLHRTEGNCYAEVVDLAPTGPS